MGEIGYSITSQWKYFIHLFYDIQEWINLLSLSPNSVYRFRFSDFSTVHIPYIILLVYNLTSILLT